MIYTITLNPALERNIWIKKIQPDEFNRIELEKRYAGGKGINVSKVLTTLGIGNRALGFVGGFAGEELEGLLVNHGVACDFVRISSETRTNIIIDDVTTGTQTVFSASGPEIKPYELIQLMNKVEKLDAPDFVIVSGSLPPGVHPEIYRKIIEMVKGKGASVILDADGDALKVGIQGFPDIIKPNIHELNRLMGVELKEIDDIIRAARRVQKQGIEVVIVSMGARGIFMVGEKEQCLAFPPEVEVKNTIGAGDSAVAGFVYGLARGKSPTEALTDAVAAGTATTLRPGTALCQKDDFLKLVSRIQLHLVEG
jgi:6-phosphofructokinase 2